MHSNIIAENMSEDNVHSLEQINTSDQSLEDAKNIIEKQVMRVLMILMTINQINKK